MSRTTLTPSLDSTPPHPSPPPHERLSVRTPTSQRSLSPSRCPGGRRARPAGRGRRLCTQIWSGESEAETARKTGKYLKSGSMKNKNENTAVREKDM